LPCIVLRITIINFLKEKLFSEFIDFALPLKMKTRYNAFRRYDLVWFKSAFVFDMDEFDINFSIVVFMLFWEIEKQLRAVKVLPMLFMRSI
jgi:hypothetical protein